MLAGHLVGRRASPPLGRARAVKAERGKCEGRKSHAEKRPEVVAEARRLRRASPTTGETQPATDQSRLAAKGLRQ